MRRQLKAAVLGAALIGAGMGAAQAHDELRVANPSGKFVIKAVPGESGVRASVVEQITLPGKGPPYHTHTREDEIFYVASGKIRFYLRDQSFVAKAGDVVLLPRRVPHTFQNAGKEPSRVLFTLAPDGLEGFFEWRNTNNPTQEEIDKYARDMFGLYYTDLTPEPGQVSVPAAKNIPEPPAGR